MAAERLRNVVRFEVTPQEQREPLKIDALVGGGAESGWGGGQHAADPPNSSAVPRNTPVGCRGLTSPWRCRDRVPLP